MIYSIVGNFCILVLFFIPTRTEPMTITERSDLAVQIDSIVTTYLEAKDFMGVIAVQQDGKLPLILPYGLASAELGVLHKASSILTVVIINALLEVPVRSLDNFITSMFYITTVQYSEKSRGHVLKLLDNFVIPARAGIQVARVRDSRLRGNDGCFRLNDHFVLDSSGIKSNTPRLCYGALRLFYH